MVKGLNTVLEIFFTSTASNFQASYWHCIALPDGVQIRFLYLWFEGSDARVAAHDGPQSARWAVKMEAGIVEESHWSGIILFTQGELWRGRGRELITHNCIIAAVLQ